MEQLDPINNITTNDLEKLNSPAYSKNVMSNLDDKKVSTQLGTPRFAMGSNDGNPTLMEPCSIEYIYIHNNTFWVLQMVFVIMYC
jgi:hypothetical protein